MLKAPFPWFGGKSRVALEVWDRFGNVPNYVEPFFGSGAVLLARPFSPQVETINDLDCFVANFWRALKEDPEAVADYADSPVNEADLSARHLWLVNNFDFQERMKTDPEYYDVRVAGWWVWGQSQWIGAGWCTGRSSWGHEFADGEPCHERLPDISNPGKGVHRKRPHLGNPGKGVHRQLPHLGNPGTGVHRKRPHLGNPGTGVHRKLPHLGTPGTGVHRKRPHLGPGSYGSGYKSGNWKLEDATEAHSALMEYMFDLADRLRRVRVCCGDWARVLGPSPTFKFGITGVLLDPPYADEADRQEGIYRADSGSIAHEVREWAVENGDNPLLRIALCGYDGEHEMPDSWECLAWKAAGGYGSQGNGRGRENASRERIWFSPACLRPQERLPF